jgi:O-antigen/teichoic acid export membrane protein
MRPFRAIAWLSAGDLLAKTLNFCAFVYLARVLGTASFGVLEFVGSILTYFLLLADGGLEVWATREAAQGRDIRQLVARIVPLRLLLASAIFAALLVLLPIFPGYPGLRALLILFGLTFFTQAANLKWLFLGREQMRRVAAGLIIAQIIFALAIFGLVRGPESILWVPVLRLAGEVATVAFFWRLFAARLDGEKVAFTLRGTREVLAPALTLGVSHGLALLNYNFDSVLLGFFLGPVAVGLYNAAYKPVTMVLAMPLTYFDGLYPVLSRAHAEDSETFLKLVTRSLRLTAVFCLPLGVTGSFLAEPIIGFLFGPAYASAASVLRVLAWSAVLVILRGTYRRALNAARRSTLDLRCAGVSAAVNVSLNILLIPIYGIVGAAAATVAAEVVWLVMASSYFNRHIKGLRLLSILHQPLAAAAAMVALFLLIEQMFWPARALLGLAVYFGVLLLLGEKEIRVWLQARKTRLPISEVGG